MSGRLTYRWPNGSATIPRVTSEWSPSRRNPVTGVIQPHNGIDVIGFPVNLSCAAGVVTFARYNGGAGNEVRVLHDDGNESRYKHNARLLVGVGQRVVQGTPLGIMGTTGQSTGIHLHFETRTAPTAASMNPRTFMAARIQSSLAGGDETPIDDDEENEMRTIQIHYKEGNKITRALVTPGTGYFAPWTEGGAAIANGMARAIPTGSSVEVTKSYFEMMRRAAAECRPSLSVTLDIPPGSNLSELDAGKLAADVASRLQETLKIPTEGTFRLGT